MGGPSPGSGEAAVTGVCFQLSAHKDEAHHVVHARTCIRIFLQQRIHEQAHVIAVLPRNGGILAAAQVQKFTSTSNLAKKADPDLDEGSIKRCPTTLNACKFVIWKADAHLMIFMVIAPRFGASKALRRQHISYRMQPKAQTSVLGPYPLPCIHQGQGFLVALSEAL